MRYCSEQHQQFFLSEREDDISSFLKQPSVTKTAWWPKLPSRFMEAYPLQSSNLWPKLLVQAFYLTGTKQRSFGSAPGKISGSVVCHEKLWRDTFEDLHQILVNVYAMSALRVCASHHWPFTALSSILKIVLFAFRYRSRYKRPVTHCIASYIGEFWFWKSTWKHVRFWDGHRTFIYTGGKDINRRWKWEKTSYYFTFAKRVMRFRASCGQEEAIRTAVSL